MVRPSPSRIGISSAALPNFILGALAYEYMNTRLYDLNASFYQLSAGIFTDWNLFWLLIATAIVGTHVAAVQMRQTRRQINEYLGTDFTKQLHAKGVSPLRFARHVLRAAVVPLTSLFVAEVLGLLLVSVFVVEAVLDIPGLGAAAWTAVNVNDGPLVLTLAVFLSVVIILASLLEDVVAVVFDPRLDK
ncbi:ABC transporter permease subunit [Halovenus salina]|uniref:ABC transporter permease subunit n=1 Tax=Halovenus salina TaxID=1510225 RepID=A0ABD5W347_9EURY